MERAHHRYQTGCWLRRCSVTVAECEVRGRRELRAGIGVLRGVFGSLYPRTYGGNKETLCKDDDAEGGRKVLYGLKGEVILHPLGRKGVYQPFKVRRRTTRRPMASWEVRGEGAAASRASADKGDAAALRFWVCRGSFSRAVRPASAPRSCDQPPIPVEGGFRRAFQG